MISVGYIALEQASAIFPLSYWMKGLYTFFDNIFPNKTKVNSWLIYNKLTPLFFVIKSVETKVKTAGLENYYLISIYWLVRDWSPYW